MNHAALRPPYSGTIGKAGCAGPSAGSHNQMTVSKNGDGRQVAFGCSILDTLASSDLSSCSLTSPVLFSRLQLLSDRARFGRVEEVSPRRFRFRPDEDDRGRWLIPSPLNKRPVLDWRLLNELPVANLNVRGSSNSIL